jgi:hypothetical protein
LTTYTVIVSLFYCPSIELFRLSSQANQMPTAAFAVMNWLLGAEIEAYGMGVGTERTVVGFN